MIKLLLPTAIFLMMVSIGTSFRAKEMWNNTRRMGQELVAPLVMWLYSKQVSARSSKTAQAPL